MRAVPFIFLSNNYSYVKAAVYGSTKQKKKQGSNKKEQGEILEGISKLSGIRIQMDIRNSRINLDLLRFYQIE
jgi:hypothetical protein